MNDNTILKRNISIAGRKGSSAFIPIVNGGDFPLRPLHPRKLNYTPFAEAVLIAQEFWSIVGGEGTMEELLSIYQEVGREKTKYMLDSLAFGF